MSNKILKPTMLALAGAVALGAAGAHASTCVYQGNTTMTDPNTGLSPTCDLTVVADVDCGTRVARIISAGAIPGDPTCVGVNTGNLPWGAQLDASGGIVGSVIDTDAVGSGLYSVHVSSSPGVAIGAAQGILTGVMGVGTVNDTCSPSGLVPAAISISGSWPATGATLSGTLANMTCY